MRLFGFSLTKARDDQENESFAPPAMDDGATVIQSSGYGGSLGVTIDLEGTVRGEAELITRYRQMSYHPEVAAAIDEITNQAIVLDDDNPTVQLDFQELEDLIPNPLKRAFEEEFKQLLRLLEFNVNSYEIFKRWYIDGRLYYHVIIDKKRLADGILELRYIDPRKIKKVREVQRTKSGLDAGGFPVQKTKTEYYVYNNNGFDGKQGSVWGVGGPDNVGVKIAPGAIVYVTSGMLDESGRMVLSYLQPAVRPLNMLRTIEDAAIIYKLVRAPQRRIWYIDVGNMPKMKAEQTVYDMMQRHRNKLIYDPTTGTTKDSRKFTTMLEDIWLTRRNGTRGTEIDTLDSQADFIRTDEINYFLKKMYKALCVPLSRLEPEYAYSIGRSSEITRDELKFNSFIERLRTRFSELFLELLERQLILRGYVSPDEWSEIRHRLRFKWAEDNFFSELKDQEILSSRIETLNLAASVIGRYVSNLWARKNILRQTDEEIEEMDQEILEERLNPIYMVPMDPEGNPIEVGPGMSPAPSMSPPPDK